MFDNSYVDRVWEPPYNRCDGYEKDIYIEEDN
jgi:hypothetical protein